MPNIVSHPDWRWLYVACKTLVWRSIAEYDRSLVLLTKEDLFATGDSPITHESDENALPSIANSVNSKSSLLASI